MITIPASSKKRVVIIGGGFGGLALARKLSSSNFQIVLIDKNNYHQFQPLFYQVATAGLEPSAIAFPFRKVFQSQKDFHVRIAEVKGINAEANEIETNLGNLNYDYLVLALGADTNYFGMENIKKHALPMKSVADSLFIRNTVLQNFEKALDASSDEEKEALLSIVIVGGGPTGVELAGSLSEMKHYILPKDYPELDFTKMNIHLIEASPKLLNGMSEASSIKSKLFLEKLGVKVSVNTSVKDYDGNEVSLDLSPSPSPKERGIKTKIVIWAAGVTSNKIEGFKPEIYTRGNRIKVNGYSKIEGYETIFAIGDMAYMTEEKYPNGHPQIAQPAIQQASLLAENLKRQSKGLAMKCFAYKNLGSMATIGRNRAVVDLPFIRFQGFLAWLTWMFVHLMAILGVKNKVLILVNWVWNYFTYDQSLRLIIRSKEQKV